MKKLITLALLAFLTFNSQSVNAQSILLVNGKATQVTLTGDQIQSIVQTKIENYMKSFDQAPSDNFLKAQIRLDKTNNNTVPTSEAQASLGILQEDITVLSSDRPYRDLKQE